MTLNNIRVTFTLGVFYLQSVDAENAETVKKNRLLGCYARTEARELIVRDNAIVRDNKRRDFCHGDVGMHEPDVRQRQ